MMANERQADDPPIENDAAPPITELLATIADLRAEVDRLSVIHGRDHDLVALKSIDRGSYSFESIRQWGLAGHIVMKKEGGRLLGTRASVANWLRILSGK